MFKENLKFDGRPRNAAWLQNREERERFFVHNHSSHRISLVSIWSSASFRFEKDPAGWIVNDELRDFVPHNGYPQNADCDSENSKWKYKVQSRNLYVYIPIVVGYSAERFDYLQLQPLTFVSAGLEDWKNAKARFRGFFYTHATVARTPFLRRFWRVSLLNLLRID